MAETDVGAERRLYGMMQHLMIHLAHGKVPEAPSPRGIVEKQDALDAVLQVAAAIDSYVQSGLVPQEPGIHAAAMLMIVREYIQPLPPGIADDGKTDRASADLDELSQLLRRARHDTGLQG